MIAHLRGRFVEQRSETVIVDVGGVGYETTVTQSVLETLPAIGGELSIVTYTDMKDTGITLYGFSDFTEREVFLLLRKVSGVGPRTALNVVSTLGTSRIYKCIGSEDIDALKKVPGVGKKTAERIIVDLREHVNSMLGNSNDKTGGVLPKSRVSSPSGILTKEETGPEYDAMLALTRLGFSKDQATAAVALATAQMASSVVNDKSSVKRGAAKPSDSDDASEILRLALANIPLKG